ncbi:uncharacterized protein LOC122088028 [Macadamia integrifolia]|uniref:uncharacterized protein LOC122088028 n=1 Tax=Macadamia integrifolia TaxID=60698 RepID=UPI001C4FD29B|nr:uncharacterized protein LOC122088028 [Macadamia integrifolia]
MKDPSFFLLKNSLGAKMKKGLRSFCNGVGSASTLNQNKVECDSSCCMVTPSIVSSSALWEGTNLEDNPLTLEEMIMQLELEEEVTRKAKLDGFDVYRQQQQRQRRRMSCVNNSDILRSARNALNQYPRFSVDGRDAMYRSSFQNLNLNLNLDPYATGSHKGGRRNSVCGSNGIRLREKKPFKDGFGLDLERTRGGLPQTIDGESVLWCRPGVVAKLMGLEAMPIPIGSDNRSRKEKLNPNCSTVRRRAERKGLEKRRVVIGTTNTNTTTTTNDGCCRRFGSLTALSGSGSNTLVGSGSGSVSTTGGYCVTKPIAVEPTRRAGRGWEALL